MRPRPDRRRPARTLALAGALAALGAGAALGQSVNESPVNNNPINPPPEPGGNMERRAVQRMLSAPRIDPSTPGGGVIAVHHRTRLLDEFGVTVGDYRESIRVFDGGDGIAISEGMGTPPDENGDIGETSAFQGKVFGGEAYEWGQHDIWAGQQLIASDEFFSAFEQNTFGGLAINGANGTGNARIAFFAGLIDEAAEMTIDRSLPPFNGQKPLPERRGIWASSGPSAALTLRAIEGDATRLAPPDPDPTRAYRGLKARLFSRLHPSDYGPFAAFDNSLFGEQRFSRVSNIAMNANGAIAFRGDLALATEPNPILGIWADQISLGEPTLHRVFVRHTGPEDTSVNAPIFFDHSGSIDPLTFPSLSYRIVDVGAPAMTDGLTPTVAAYAVLWAAGVTPARSFHQVAIVTRQVGVDGAHPQGFKPRIVAIEGERFSINGSSTFGEFVVSETRNDREPPDGLPGLADMPGNGFQVRSSFKDVEEFTTSFSIFQPRPAINDNGTIAFLGRIDRFSDAANNEIPLSVDELAAVAESVLVDNYVRDEGVWSNRGASGPGDLELIVFEGDPAPVVVNGVALLGARFVATEPVRDFTFALQDRQTFFRPVINNKGEVAFIGRWVHEPAGGQRTFGQSIFVSRAPGNLECLVSSGDLTTAEFNVPGQPQPVRGVMLDEFCRVPNPSITNSLGPGNVSYEQVGWTDAGVLAFTTRLRRDDSSGADLGWGLFLFNTAEPTGPGFTPLGPQLVVKTSTGSEVEGDDLFRLPIVGDLDVEHGEQHHHGIAIGFGESVGGDAVLHPSGKLAFGINPDAGTGRGLVVRAEPQQQSLDWDLDGVLDGNDNCPTTFNPNQADLNGDGVGDACQGGGGGGGCTDCLLCISEEDCPFEGLLLGAGPDFDQSGFVDETDVTLMLRAMGNPGGRCDLDKDGMVGEKDLALLMEQFGQTVTKEADGTK